jgi:hypothetical protein
LFDSLGSPNEPPSSPLSLQSPKDLSLQIIEDHAICPQGCLERDKILLKLVGGQERGISLGRHSNVINIGSEGGLLDRAAGGSQEALQYVGCKGTPRNDTMETTDRIRHRAVHANMSAA